MPKTDAVYTPWLHMHQPPIIHQDQIIGNLEKMLQAEDNSEERWNAGWYAMAYSNPARYCLQLLEQGFNPSIMVDYSAVLLEEMVKLSDNGIFDSITLHGQHLGNPITLWRQALEQAPNNIEFAGSAYSHCYFPVTPSRDHYHQIQLWRQSFANIFGDQALARVRGFWLPEMGMMGNAKDALQFIRLLKKCQYQWLILPAGAIKAQDNWNTPELENQAHWLVVRNGQESERIICIVRDTQMGIRQQSGHNPDGILSDIIYRIQALGHKTQNAPALVVPTSDGENGNVMMFEFFDKMFSPLMRQIPELTNIESMTISAYLDKFLPNGPSSEISLQELGGSWIGNHDSWQQGSRRQQIMTKIDDISRRFHALETQRPGMLDWKKLMLLETSCFVYWNDEFWFDQADQFIALTQMHLDSVTIT